jgi:dephospho-CoA kinase
MMNIAITGGIGAGKSTIVKQLEQLYEGANFYSMDKFVDELYTEQGWLDWLYEKFQTTDREIVSKLVFSDREIRNMVNLQSSLKIGMKLGKALSMEGMNFVEFPLLFETNMQGEFDLVVHITASFDTRVDRVVARGKKSRVEAMSVIANQMSEEKKMEMADITVDTTSSTPEECAEEISDAIYEYLVGEHE